MAQNNEHIQQVIDYVEKLDQFDDHEGLGDFSDRTFMFMQSRAWTPALWDGDIGKPVGISVDGICAMLNFENPTSSGSHLADIIDWMGVDEKNAGLISVPPKPMNWYTAKDAIKMLQDLIKTGIAEWPDVMQPDGDEDFMTGMELEVEDDDDDDDEGDF